MNIHLKDLQFIKLLDSIILHIYAMVNNGTYTMIKMFLRFLNSKFFSKLNKVTTSFIIMMKICQTKNLSSLKKELQTRLHKVNPILCRIRMIYIRIRDKKLELKAIKNLCHAKKIRDAILRKIIKKRWNKQNKITIKYQNSTICFHN